MSRAFLYAGADSLVVSLWSVADQETKDFMVDFYSAIQSGTERRHALVEAKRNMINRGLAPMFWAPFIFVGVD
jgi:CHAT domain-containing protein